MLQTVMSCTLGALHSMEPAIILSLTNIQLWLMYKKPEKKWRLLKCQCNFQVPSLLQNVCKIPWMTNHVKNLYQNYLTNVCRSLLKEFMQISRNNMSFKKSQSLIQAFSEIISRSIPQAILWTYIHIIKRPFVGAYGRITASCNTTVFLLNCWKNIYNSHHKYQVQSLLRNLCRWHCKKYVRNPHWNYLANLSRSLCMSYPK